MSYWITKSMNTTTQIKSKEQYEVQILRNEWDEESEFETFFTTTDLIVANDTLDYNAKTLYNGEKKPHRIIKTYMVTEVL